MAAKTTYVLYIFYIFHYILHDFWFLYDLRVDKFMSHVFSIKKTYI